MVDARPPKPTTSHASSRGSLCRSNTLPRIYYLQRGIAESMRTALRDASTKWVASAALLPIDGVTRTDDGDFCGGEAHARRRQRSGEGGLLASPRMRRLAAFKALPCHPTSAVAAAARCPGTRSSLCRRDVHLINGNALATAPRTPPSRSPAELFLISFFLSAPNATSRSYRAPARSPPLNLYALTCTDVQSESASSSGARRVYMNSMNINTSP